MLTRLIALEGIDTSGKTSASIILKKHLQDIGFKAAIIKNPWGIPMGRKLMEMRKECSSKASQALLHSVINCEIASLIKAKSEFDYLILDRYYISTIAYNCVDENLKNIIRQINNSFLGKAFFIFLDINKETYVKRLKEKEKVDYIEREVSKNFDDLRQRYMDEIKLYDHEILDANNKLEEVIANLKYLIQRLTLNDHN